MAEIKLENIHKLFDKQAAAVRDFNLQVEDGKFVTILGPSGSGKSTVLRIIAGLERQDQGAVFIDGINVNSFPPQERNIAFVFQNYALYPHMDVYENIAVGLRLKGYPNNEIKKRVQEVTELLEIGELLKRKPKALSGGQRQRVALARAIAKRPKVFLLDEPLSNLDALLRERMRTELKTLFNRLKATVVYVTHDQLEAMSLSDKIVLIDKGVIKQEGTLEALYYQPRDLFVASFLGSPRINVFEVSVVEDNFVYGELRWKIPEIYRSRLAGISRLILGIRPEDVKIYPESKPDRLMAKIVNTEKMGKFVTLNLAWPGRFLKAFTEKDSVAQFKSDDSLWIEFNKERYYLFDINSRKLL